MKTLEELYNEIISNEELRAKLDAADKEGKIDEVLASIGCEFSEKEISEYFLSKAEQEYPKICVEKGVTPLTEEELENVAGGTTWITVDGEEHAVVTSACRCRNGHFWMRAKPDFWDRPLRTWWDFSSRGQCGCCGNLRIRSGIGYCSFTGNH